MRAQPAPDAPHRAPSLGRAQASTHLGEAAGAQARSAEHPRVGASLDRCYTASYDPDGNPVYMTDPEGNDTLVYDALNRLVQVSRSNGVVEDYAYNTLGALSVNAGQLLNVQRPRLDGNGMADSAVPYTFNGLPVTLDPGGRITSLNGATLTYGERNELQQIVDGTTTETYGFDGLMRRVARVNNQGVEEYYAYDDTTLTFNGAPLGMSAQLITNGQLPADVDRMPNTLDVTDSINPQNIVAVLDNSGGVTSALLYDDIDHPLRLNRSGFIYYYEVDLAGNVRRLRDTSGNDLGGYRYTAFGESYPADATTPTPVIDQPLQWKGRWFSSLASGIYDVRARQWAPGMGVFTTVDELAIYGASTSVGAQALIDLIGLSASRFPSRATTLWGWPNQEPTLITDTSGRQADECIYIPDPNQCRNNCKADAQLVYDVCIGLGLTESECQRRQTNTYNRCVFFCPVP